MNEHVAPAPADHAYEDQKPLTLMLPWLGARPQAVAKYCDIYLRTGFDVLVVESEVSIYYWRKGGLSSSAYSFNFG